MSSDERAADAKRWRVPRGTGDLMPPVAELVARIGNGDGQPETGPPREPGEDDGDAEPRYPRAPSLVDVILARSSEPWISLGLDGAEIASLRLGSVAMLMGGAGSGKSTLAAALLAEHARLHGPAVYLSLELDGDELAARVIGMHVGAAWVDVLRGQVDRARMVDSLPDRLVILERDGADLSQLGAVVEDLRAHHDGPVLVALDYLQLSAAGPDLRAATAAIAEQLRREAKRLRVVALGVSQTSRAAGRALRSGELVGVEAMTAGAESSSIERCAYLTLSIGTIGPPGADGYAAVELSRGKARFGGGDQVVPMEFHGAYGRWRVAGAARRASDVLAERAAGRDDAKVRAAGLAMITAADRSAVPLGRRDLRERAACAYGVGQAAVAALLASGELVEMPRPPRSRYALLWTPAARDRASSRDE